MIIKTNRMFWDENEKTGYRHLSVDFNDRVLMAVTAYKVDSVWEAQVIPMGYSFKHSEIQELGELFKVLPSVMEFLCTWSLSTEEIEKYLLTVFD